MKKFNVYLLIGVLLSSIVGIVGCTKTDEDIEEITFRKETSRVLNVGNSITVSIKTGNGNYVANPEDPQVATALVMGKQILITGVSEGSTVINVSDAQDKTAQLFITVTDITVDLELSATDITVANGASANVSVTSGNGKYVATVADPDIAEVSISDDVIVINGLNIGKTQVTVKDRKEKSVVIDVNVVNPIYGAYLGYNYVKVPFVSKYTKEDPSLCEIKQLSFEAWVNFDSYNFLNAVMGLEGNIVIRVNKYGGVTPKFDAYVNDYSKQDPECHVDLWGTEEVEFGRWYHVVLTFDGTGEDGHYRFYVNGEKVSEAHVTNNYVDFSKVNFAAEDSQEFYIGRSTNATQRPIVGAVSQVRIWKKTLTDSEVTDNMESIEVPVDSEGLMAYWKFDENTPTTEIKDATGHGYDGEAGEVIKDWPLVLFP